MGPGIMPGPFRLQPIRPGILSRPHGLGLTDSGGIQRLSDNGAAAVLLTVAPRVVGERQLQVVVKQGQRAAAQTTLRWAIVLLRPEQKLDAVGYGIFIPQFFVCSGMTLDIHSIASDPLRSACWCSSPCCWSRWLRSVSTTALWCRQTRPRRWLPLMTTARRPSTCGLLGTM